MIKQAVFFPLFTGMLFVLLVLPQTVFAIGISPSLILVENISQNSAVRKQVFFSRGNPAFDEEVKITVGGPLASYIEKTDGDTIVLPKGQKITPYNFTIKTGTLGAGTYEASIAVAQLPPTLKPDEEVTGATILTGAQAKIQFSVATSAVEKYEIKDVLTGETEEGQIIGFFFIMANQGNADARPSKIEFTATDTQDPDNVLSDVIAGDSIPPVKAFSEERVGIKTKVSLTQGTYALKFVFYNQESVIRTVERRMQIWPRGTLAQKGELVSFSADKTLYQQGETAKFLGSFKNTGQTDLDAALIIEVFKGQNRIELLRKENVFVPLYQTVNFEQFFRIPGPGSYEAAGYVSFGPYKSNEQKVQFQIKELNIALVAAAIGVVAIFLALGVWFIFLRKKS